MSRAKVCRNCPQFKISSTYCNLHKRMATPWSDWCDEREKQWNDNLRGGK